MDLNNRRTGKHATKPRALGLLGHSVIDSDVHTSFYDKRDEFGFPIVSLPGWVVMFLDSRRTVFTFLSWLDLLGVALAFWISILKKSSNYFQIADTGLQISQASKNIWKILQVILWAFI